MTVDVDAEFRTVLLRVVAIGTPIMVLGAIALYFAFRAFVSRQRGLELRAVVLVAATIAIVMGGSVILLLFSFPRR